MNSAVLKHFETVDPILHAAAIQIPNLRTLEKSDNYFRSLCRTIIGQQLSGKVADVIFARFVALFADGDISPDSILEQPDQRLRDIGMSWSKVAFIKDLALKTKHKEIAVASLDTFSDEAVMQELRKVKGIGPWTVEMFLMFSLAREDIFSLGDLGLKNAMKKLYAFKRDPSPKKILELSQKWSPYRTYACLVLWESLDAKGE